MVNTGCSLRIKGYEGESQLFTVFHYSGLKQGYPQFFFVQKLGSARFVWPYETINLDEMCDEPINNSNVLFVI